MKVLISRAGIYLLSASNGKPEQCVVKVNNRDTMMAPYCSGVFVAVFEQVNASWIALVFCSPTLKYFDCFVLIKWQKQPPEVWRCSIKKMLLKYFLKFHKKIPVLESLNNIWKRLLLQCQECYFSVAFFFYNESYVVVKVVAVLKKERLFDNSLNAISKSFSDIWKVQCCIYYSFLMGQHIYVYVVSKSVN